jgi:hippurate hydrolase
MQSISTLCTLEETQDLGEELHGMRHHLHRHPELAYQEFQTSDFVATAL